MDKNLCNLGEGDAINEKCIIFKTFAAFTDCTIKINKTQVENAKELDIVIDNMQLIGI